MNPDRQTLGPLSQSIMKQYDQDHIAELPASDCSPSIYEVIRNNITAMDPNTREGRWGIEVLQEILHLSPKENPPEQ